MDRKRMRRLSHLEAAGGIEPCGSARQGVGWSEAVHFPRRGAEGVAHSEDVFRTRSCE